MFMFFAPQMIDTLANNFQSIDEIKKYSKKK